MNPYEVCTLCPRACRVNRQAGGRGRCGMTAEIRLARAALHHWEEPCISGTAGSGAIFFAGCPLGCVYCQNRAISSGEAGVMIPPARLTEIFWELKEKGAHNINLVTATHFAPTVADCIRAVRAEGFDLPFVWNTSGYETPETLALLSGLIDIYLTDLRYMRAETARLYSGAADYPAVAKAVLRQMVADTGPCAFDDAGILKRGTVVRILLLPGHLAEAKLALVHLNKYYRGRVWVSLMQQYTPMPGMLAPLDRRVTPEEYASLVRFAMELGLTDAYTQEREAATESFIPPFDETGVRKEHS